MIFPSLKKIIFIFVLTAVCLYISLPENLGINFGPVNTNLQRHDIRINLGERVRIEKNLDLVLGLDLAGGSHLVFEADTQAIEEGKKKTAIESVREVIERRVNLFGVSEPNVVTSSFEGKDRIIVELPGISDTADAVDLIGQTAQLVFAETGADDEPGIIPTDLTGADLVGADVVFDQTSGKPAVGIEFTSEGADKFFELTQKNVGKPLVILLDDNLVSAPIVETAISGGSAQITGEFSLEEARNLSIQLNAGALPVSVEIVEQRTVGATLGAESVQRSITAGLIGLAMVMLFMVLVYGKMGLIADIGLIIFGLITLSLYKLIPVVLTLPGIAGFLLSVGMAVDANILIFERFKEERQRRDFSNALETAFGRAWDSIRDANIATLVTAFVLANPLDFQFLHTSGAVRGFAITLALGIVISLFTGIFVSRNLMRAFVKEVK
jgi:preprotein translocase subunit SecD